MKIKIKEIEEGFSPKFMSEGAACMDVFAREVEFDSVNWIQKIKLGFSVEVPKGYVMLLFPRSSVSNRILTLANSIGVIDPDFRGEVQARFYANSSESSLYQEGDAVGQIMFIKNPTRNIELLKVDSLEETERGDGGFGSTGK